MLYLALWTGLIACSALAQKPLGYERAALYPVAFRGPAVDFFSGAVLGNGGLGAIVTTRPDAIVIYFGHNNVWDIRLAENHRQEIGTFQYVFNKVKSMPDTLATLTENEWFSHYVTMARDNYAKPYPRPFPCGSVLLGFDRSLVEVLGHSLNIADGLCTVSLLVRGKPAALQIFVEQDRNILWFELQDSSGTAMPNVFERIRIMPDPSTPKEFPVAVTGNDSHSLCFTQVLPGQEPERYDLAKGDDKDRYFRLSAHLQPSLATHIRLDWEGNPKYMGPLERALDQTSVLYGCILLEEGLRKNMPQGSPVVSLATPFMPHLQQAQQSWQLYWSHSAVQLQDAELEKIWYRNLYFLNCSAKAGVTCPGLFANWNYNTIGTAWHGDYHMNYNTQQAFWATFSSNHMDKNLPYVDLVKRLLPVSRKWAKEYYGLRGAYFPHSAYPVEMTMNPYPVPTWGWEICETPWSVQGLWWHYLYSMDDHFLRETAFSPIQEAVLFLVDYMKRPEARGAVWKDDRYHIFPTVPPELYGLKPGYKYNYDCLVDLTLTKFIFKAYQQAVGVLHLQKQEASLLKEVADILAHFPDYPTAATTEGPVFVSVPGERSDVVYNVPNNLMTAFPGEEHGLHSPADVLEQLRRSFRNIRIEGGNELVFLNLQAARIGELDLEKWKRQAEYCQLPNGTYADMVLQVHGRYSDTTTPYDFMKDMGIWFENFGMPVVINESLLQSYNGIIRLFPNWPQNKKAAFHDLRAVGAFLVSAEMSENSVQRVTIKSEAGGKIRLYSPWPPGTTVNVNGKAEKMTSSILEWNVAPGAVQRLSTL
jgi:alpha-L-fucosidase 2